MGSQDFLNLNKGLNVLIGENDSGKTCIIDAIRFVLLTQSREYLRIDKDDFHNGAKELRIECIFRVFQLIRQGFPGMVRDKSKQTVLP